MIRVFTTMLDKRGIAVLDEKGKEIKECVAEYSEERWDRWKGYHKGMEIERGLI